MSLGYTGYFTDDRPSIASCIRGLYNRSIVIVIAIIIVMPNWIELSHVSLLFQKINLSSFIYAILSRRRLFQCVFYGRSVSYESKEVD